MLVVINIQRIVRTQFLQKDGRQKNGKIVACVLIKVTDAHNISGGQSKENIDCFLS